MFDFGFAALDILTVNAEDSGEYTIKATNSLGTASSSAKINVTGRTINLFLPLLQISYFDEIPIKKKQIQKNLVCCEYSKWLINRNLDNMNPTYFVLCQ